MRICHNAAAVVAGLLVCAWSGFAWDYEGHRTINQLALASLPTNFPAFVRDTAAVERIAFLAGEPDRWRNIQDLTFKHASGPEHYIDIEQLKDYGLTAEKLPIFRADFIGQLAVIRNRQPDKFAEFDSAKNQDHTRELVGLLPWAIAENFGKLKSCFSYLRTFQEDGGTRDEIANAQANILYVMGTMGHLVGDAAQPLHTTIHHHGWVGDNPEGFSTNTRIHSWIDGGYFSKVGPADAENLRPKLRPAQLVSFNGRPAKADEMFQTVMNFIIDQNKEVQVLYRMEKEGRLSGNGSKGLEGKAFLEEQLLKGAQMLGDIWFSACQQAPPDTFLKGQLAKRKQTTERTR